MTRLAFHPNGKECVRAAECLDIRRTGSAPVVFENRVDEKPGAEEKKEDKEEADPSLSCDPRQDKPQTEYQKRAACEYKSRYIAVVVEKTPGIGVPVAPALVLGVKQSREGDVRISDPERQGEEEQDDDGDQEIQEYSFFHRKALGLARNR
jgi:hypothetical protein